MVNVFFSPLFWGIFLLTSAGAFTISKFDLIKRYKAWLNLPLSAPRFIFTLHVTIALFLGVFGLRILGPLGGVIAPLAFYGGKVFLKLRYEEELQAYQRFLPDLLELIALCLSTGLSLPFTLERLLPFLEKREPLWADAIKGVLAELKLGLSLNTAFEHMAEQIPLPALKRITNMVGHAEQYGTQLTPLFKQMAKDMKDAHLAEIETKAQKLPVYLSLILVIFFLPSLLLVTLAPLLLRLIESLSLAFS